MNQDCIFCKIASKEIPAEIIFENDEILAFKDINPQAPVHVLIVPKKHIETLNHVSGDDAGLVSKVFLKAAEISRESGIADEGYRIVANCNRGAGQEVFHIHFHLLGGRKFTWPPG